MAGRMRTDETSMLKRRIRADKRLREELSRNNAETREMIHETYQEIAEQLEIEQLKEGKLTFSAAYELSGMSKEDQEEI